MSNGTGSNILLVELFTTGANGNIWTIDFNAIDYAYLIEDLFSFSITGKIVFYDRIGISEFGPLNGSEKIKFMFGNTEGDVKYKTVIMDILQIKKIERVSGERPASNDLIELILVDEYYHRWHSHFWSKSWTDTKISDIINDICNYHIGIESFVEFESTEEKVEYFDSHMRTPAECVSWLMNRASGTVSKQPGYLLYHGNNPKTDFFGHSFITLEQLIKRKEFMKPYDGNTGKSAYVFENENPNYINKIKDHEVQNVDLNALKSISGGTMYGYDIRRKKLIKRVYTYKDAINRYTILGKKTLFPAELNIDHPMQEVDGYSDENILDNLWYSGWIKEYVKQHLVHITVDGHSQRKCGGMIRIIWPSHDEPDSRTYGGEYFNKQMDGRYLVKSITHYFDKNLSYGWQQKLVCIKNGYKDSPNPRLIDAVKRNL